MIEPSRRFYDIIMSFQQFAGQSIKVLDHASALSGEDLDVIENSLRKVVASLRKEDPMIYPDLHKLADKVEKSLKH